MIRIKALHIYQLLAIVYRQLQIHSLCWYQLELTAFGGKTPRRTPVQPINAQCTKRN